MYSVTRQFPADGDAGGHSHIWRNDGAVDRDPHDVPGQSRNRKRRQVQGCFGYWKVGLAAGSLPAGWWSTPAMHWTQSPVKLAAALAGSRPIRQAGRPADRQTGRQAKASAWTSNLHRCARS